MSAGGPVWIPEVTVAGKCGETIFEIAKWIVRGLDKIVPSIINYTWSQPPPLWRAIKRSWSMTRFPLVPSSSDLSHSSQAGTTNSFFLGITQHPDLKMRLEFRHIFLTPA